MLITIQISSKSDLFHIGVCPTPACRQVFFLVLPSSQGSLGHLLVKVNAIIKQLLIFACGGKNHWKSSRIRYFLCHINFFNCMIRMLSAGVLLFLSDYWWECCALCTSKSLDGHLLYSCYFTTLSAEYFTFFFIIPSEMDVRLVTWILIFALLIIGVFVHFSTIALIFC